MCIRKLSLYAFTISVLFSSSSSIATDRQLLFDCAQQVDNGLQYPVVFLKVNRYRTGADVDRSDDATAGELAITPVEPACAGVRLNDEWVLTTDSCALRICRDLNTTDISGPIYKAIDLTGYGVGYVVSNENIFFVPVSDFALIGLEDPVHRSSYPQQKAGNSGSRLGPLGYRNLVGSDCGYITLKRYSESGEFSSIQNSPVIGEPLFTSVQTPCNKGYMVTGLVSACRGGFFSEPAECNSTYITDDIREYIRNFIENTFVNDTLLMPKPYQICEHSASDSHNWGDRPLWDTTQGIVFMVEVLAFTAIVSGGIGYGCHVLLNRRK